MAEQIPGIIFPVPMANLFSWCFYSTSHSSNWVFHSLAPAGSQNEAFYLMTDYRFVCSEDLFFDGTVHDIIQVQPSRALVEVDLFGCDATVALFVARNQLPVASAAHPLGLVPPEAECVANLRFPNIEWNFIPGMYCFILASCIIFFFDCFILRLGISSSIQASLSSWPCP